MNYINKLDQLFQELEDKDEFSGVVLITIWIFGLIQHPLLNYLQPQPYCS